MGFEKGTLNQSQYDAVVSTSKRLLVLSGAGSGKTHTVISKIIYLIDVLGVSPYNILALTFSNKAAEEVEQRVKTAIPDVLPGAITIKTFHKLGSLLLRLFGSEVGLDPRTFAIYDDTDSTAILKSVYPDTPSRTLKPIIQHIQEAKDLGFNSNTYSTWHKSTSDMQKYFEDYENALRKSGNVDFADLINLPIELLKNSDSAKQYVYNKFKYVFVDEYQDINNTQFEFLKLLINDDTTLCAVGDDDQSIYSFRGANVDHILKFTDTFENSDVQTLEQNYRSSKSIIALSNSLIKKNKERLDKTLWTNNPEGEQPILISYFTSANEAKQVVNMIKKVPENLTCAVIYRTNAQSREFEIELNNQSIPYRILKSASFFDREVVKDALSYIGLSQNFNDFVSFSRIAAKPARSIGKAAITEIAQGTSTTGADIFKEGFNRLTTQKALASLKELKQHIDDANNALDNGDIFLFMQNLFKDTGFIDYCKEKDEKEETDIENSSQTLLKTFCQSLKDIKNREELHTYMENINLRSASDEADKSHVVLSTMHAVKGLEFDICFVTGVEDEIIPSQKSSTTQKEIEEERRLLYVALTRAKRLLYISYCQKRYKFGRYEDAYPSRFLKDLNENLYQKMFSTNDYSSKEIRSIKKYSSGKIYNSTAKNSNPFSSTKTTTTFSSNPFENTASSSSAVKDFLNKRSEKISTSTEKIITVKSKYNIGDRIEYSKDPTNIRQGKIRNVRKLGSSVVVDIVLDDGQKTSLSEISKLIRKI